MVRYVAAVASADAGGATIPSVLHERAELTPDAVAVTHGAASASYAEVLMRAAQAAAALTDAGVAAGDTVAVMLPNGLPFLDLWFGTALLGAVLVPVNTGLVGDGLRHVVLHSDSGVLVADEPGAAACDAALGGAGPRRRFCLGAPCEGWEDGGAWLAGTYSPVEVGPARVVPSTPASILYTSGTTGQAKGVVNGHNAYVVAGAEFTRRAVRVRDGDVLYTSLPLFHVNAQMLSVMGGLVAGVPLVLAERFSASGFLDDVRRTGATVFNYIGAMLTMIGKQPERDDDADTPLRLAAGGAAPADLWPAFERRFGLSILEMYGLTETATVCVANPPDDVRVGRIGRAVSWAEVRVAGGDGDGVSEAPVDTPGEILVRATRPDVLFQGYYKQPEATAGALAGGWFHTGDRGRRDGDGYLTFLDRIKDVIRRRGENISSFEVERAANAHPAVAEAAAIGVPSDLGEEDVLIVVVARPGTTLDPAQLVAHCGERLAAFMVPRYVRVVDALPKTATERVQKFRLRQDGLVAGTWDGLVSPDGDPTPPHLASPPARGGRSAPPPA